MGIKFSNIGTFCFTLCEVPPEAGIIGKIKRPIFILSEKICYTHLVSQGRRSIEGSIPVVNLNICELSLKTNFPKHRIEKCLDEVLFTVNQYLHQEKAIEILFTDIGWLRIDKRRAKFRFFRSFLLEFEKSGALIQALKNRPGTCDSVITSVSNKSHGSSRTAKLTTNILGPIVEESNPGSFGVEKENILKLGKTIPSSSNQGELPDPGGSARTAITISSVRYIEPSPTLEVNGIQEENEQNYTQETESHELPEDIHIDGEESKDADEEDVVGPQNTLDRQADSAAADCVTYGGSRWLSMPKLPSFSGANLDFTTVSSQTTEEKRLQSSATLSVSSHTSSKPSTTGSSRERRKHLSEKFRALQTRCSHTQKYGQELCYICHQREARNIPVDMKEEIRHQEEAEEELFHVYQRMRAESSLKKEQEAALTRKADLKKQAAYNRGVADAKQMKRGYRDETGYKTFIFSDRAPTPPAIVKQTEMRTNLDEQTKLRVDEQQRLKDVEDEAGREEQAKLAMKLRIQRRQEFDDKVARQRKYKDELDKQPCV
ncbi:unnamed protein product [Calicophoron daubneyi]|uniref:CCDC81 HU domain-containing protein n=1 Tax=Calicophoron daubneyi TaxID=300641 RepID=A0AAV2TU99_CALDB